MAAKEALLIVDVQLDFCPGGALAVPEGDQVVSVLNRYMARARAQGWPVFASRDWHPGDSAHFRDHGGIWPAHCVAGTEGAEFHPALLIPEEATTISKGLKRSEDGYSALEGIGPDGTPMPELLRRLKVGHLYVGGLATDYCVKRSVLGLLELGYAVTLLADACRGVNLQPDDSERALREMQEAGATLATLETLGW